MVVSGIKKSYAIRPVKQEKNPLRPKPVRWIIHYHEGTKKHLPKFIGLQMIETKEIIDFVCSETGFNEAITEDTT